MREDCVWLKMGVCLDRRCDGCRAHLASGSMRGRELYERHKKEVVEAISPVMRKYRSWLARYKRNGYREEDKA